MQTAQLGPNEVSLLGLSGPMRWFCKVKTLHFQWNKLLFQTCPLDVAKLSLLANNLHTRAEQVGTSSHSDATLCCKQPWHVFYWPPSVTQKVSVETDKVDPECSHTTAKKEKRETVSICGYCFYNIVPIPWVDQSVPHDNGCFYVA